MIRLLNAKKEKVYVDVNIFLNPLLYDIKKNINAKKADLFLNKIINNEIEAHTSFLTWDELVWVIRKNLDLKIAQQKGKEFLMFPNLIFDEINDKIIKKAQDLSEFYSIKPRDAIHLASALNENIKEIITFDDDFKNIKEIYYHAP